MRHAPLIMATALIGGCSIFQSQELPLSEEQDCKWAQTRGVAELVRLEDNMALMNFFPGEHHFQTPKENDWEKGDEFKVLLEIPSRTECGQPRVQEIHPLTVTD